MKSSSLLLPALAATMLFAVAFARGDDSAPVASPTTVQTATSSDANSSDVTAPKHARRAAMAERRYEHLLKRYDKNGDGKLDATERAAAFADLQTKPAIIKRFDTDGDGKLSPQEVAQMEAVLNKRWDALEAQHLAAASNANNNAAPADSTQ